MLPQSIVKTIRPLKSNILFPQDAQLWLDIFFGDALVMAKEAMPILQETDAALFIKNILIIILG